MIKKSWFSQMLCLGHAISSSRMAWSPSTLAQARLAFQHTAHSVAYLLIPPLFVILLVSSCSRYPQPPPPDHGLAYRASGNSLLASHSPIFIVEQPGAPYNRIATPRPVVQDDSSYSIEMDTDFATIYGEQRFWTGQSGRFTNLIYRVHFQQIPYSIMPFYLGSGKNVGLFVIITMDTNLTPLLITTVHTCGCYLAFLPTSSLSNSFFPDSWPAKKRQQVYGKNLPSIINLPPATQSFQPVIYLNKDTHRVYDIRTTQDLAAYPVKATSLEPLASLARLGKKSTGPLSLFAQHGHRKDYVIGSQKIWERLFISWWAFDWHVGEDKRLGKDLDDGIVFYTSLKPWARSASDLRDFASFLSYWGWGL